MKNIEIRIQKDFNGERFDIAFVRAGIGLSRRKIRSIIDRGGAYLNGKRLRIASRTVRRDDVCRLVFLEEEKRAQSAAVIELLPAHILHEDEHVFVINKPPGLASQPTVDQALDHVLTAVQKLFVKMGRTQTKLSLVHRLDKETSGILVLAKSKAVADWFLLQFKERTIKKTYHALVWGAPAQKRFHVENHLSRVDPKTGMVKAVRAGGRMARTEFEVLKNARSRVMSLVQCTPLTGRTHQIRVHLDSLGFPIVGDKKYGQLLRKNMASEIYEQASQHHMLHAKGLEFRPAPGAKLLRLEAAYPPAFQALLNLF